MSEIEKLKVVVTELESIVDVLRERSEIVEDALRSIGEQWEKLAEENLNRDVRLGLIEGRLDISEADNKRLLKLCEPVAQTNEEEKFWNQVDKDGK